METGLGARTATRDAERARLAAASPAVPDLALVLALQVHSNYSYVMQSTQHTGFCANIAGSVLLLPLAACRASPTSSRSALPASPRPHAAGCRARRPGLQGVGHQAPYFAGVLWKWVGKAAAAMMSL